MELDLNFLETWLSTYTPTGLEYLGSEVWRKKMSQVTNETTIYNNGNIIATTYASRNESLGKIILEAHIDEISWRIVKINDDGIIKVRRNGGSDSGIAPSKTAIIHLPNGEKIEGVFGHPAIHVRKEKNEPKVKELIFDTGYNKKELEDLGVHVGLVITFDDMPKILDRGELGDIIIGRALDNKLGGYILYEVAKRLKKEIGKGYDLGIDIVFANCISEEVGLFGAKILAKELKTNETKGKKILSSLVVDVTHDTTVSGTDTDVEGDIKIGDGGVIEHSAQCHYKLNEMAVKLCKEKNIKFQHAVGGFGNDTVSFYENGIDTTIISIPLKYMHTTVEMASLNDVKSIIQIFLEMVKKINSNVINKVYKFT